MATTDSSADHHTGASDSADAYSVAIGRQFKRALNLSMLAVIALGAVYFLQPQWGNLAPFALVPQQVQGLPGIVTAPLLHGSFEHLASNAFSILVLGTLAGTLYPKATLRALPLIWLGSGLGTWLIALGGHHIGASGVTHGLMFFLATQGLLRRDRPAIAAMLIGMFFFGGMLLSILPQAPDISWQYHFSGAVMGVLAGLLWRHRDAGPPAPRYSWEDESDDASRDDEDADVLEPPRPEEVPVLWQRPPEERGKVLEFRRRDQDSVN